MFLERNASVSISLYYFYLQFNSGFNLKSWKFWGRWSTKYIHLFFMPFFHWLLRVSFLYAMAFLDVPYSGCKGKVSMPAVCKTCLSMFAIIISASEQQFPEDHKWKQENGDFSKCVRYLHKKLSKISHCGESVGKAFPRLRASSRPSISQLFVHLAL